MAGTVPEPVLGLCPGLGPWAGMAGTVPEPVLGLCPGLGPWAGMAGTVPVRVLSLCPELGPRTELVGTVPGPVLAARWETRTGSVHRRLSSCTLRMPARTRTVRAGWEPALRFSPVPVVLPPLTMTGLAPARRWSWPSLSHPRSESVAKR